MFKDINKKNLILKYLLHSQTLNSQTLNKMLKGNHNICNLYSNFITFSDRSIFWNDLELQKKLAGQNPWFEMNGYYTCRLYSVLISIPCDKKGPECIF